MTLLFKIKLLNNYLTNYEKITFVLITFIGLLSAFIEIATIGLVYIFFSFLLDTNEVIENKYFLIVQKMNWGLPMEKYLLLIILIIFIFKSVFYISFRGFFYNFTKKMQTKFGCNILHNYLNKNFSFFLKHTKSRVINNIGVIPNSIIQHFIGGGLDITISLMTILILLGFLFTVSPTISILIIIASILFCSLYFFCISDFLKKQGDIMVKSNETLYKRLNEFVDGIKSIIIFDLKKKFFTEIEQTISTRNKISKNIGLVSEIPKVSLELLIIIFICTGVIIIYDSQNYQTLIPELILFGTTTIRVSPHLSKIMVNLNYFNLMEESLQRIVSSDLQIKKSVKIKQEVNINFNKYIEFKDIKFKYVNDFVIKNLSIKIRKNKFIGFTGHSGSGKTTFINILLGLLEINKGQILVDGKLITNQIDLKSLSSFVPQEPFLLNTSLEKNITLGKNPINFTKNDLLKDFKEKKLGEGGVRLSGGQSQIVSFLRAISHKKKILVLDEPTASLDGKNERNILNLIEKEKKNKTIIMITHKINTLKKCDEIFLFKDGNISSSGSFSKLYNKSRDFKTLVELYKLDEYSKGIK